ncbi:MAG: MBOAT family protein, partial [Flavobacteriaceae bacterium]|nr:MBOAT family protein [Bacteroidia bacterium]NNL62128.1 MBOAT family protein [Flavobacteriaceae bacterium]
FRDYLYIPLGGSRGSKWNALRNTIIVFIVSGFWHGANWTFITWGAIHAIFFVPLLLLNRNRRYLGEVAADRLFPRLGEFMNILITFALVTLAWVFFRAETIAQALDYFMHMFDLSLIPDRLEIKRYAFEILPLIFILFSFEWFSRQNEHPMQRGRVWVKTTLIIAMLLALGNYSNMQEFIYFQF